MYSVHITQCVCAIASSFLKFLLLFGFALPEFVTILSGVSSDSLPVYCFTAHGFTIPFSIGNDVNDFLWHSKRVMETTCIFNVHLNSMNDGNIRSSGRYGVHSSHASKCKPNARSLFHYYVRFTDLRKSNDTVHCT